MDYGTYQKIAENYVIEQKDNLDVLKTYNKSFEDKVYEHMLSLMLKNHNQNGIELKKTMYTCKAHFRRFIAEHRA